MVMETMLQNINIENLQMIIIIISVLILTNLVVSIMESIKLKNFSIKKLPEFIGEWFMSCLSLILIELLISTLQDQKIIGATLLGLKDIMIFSIVGCYLKKIFESLKILNWDVNVDNFKNYIDNKK